jgi:K319-like protein
MHRLTTLRLFTLVSLVGIALAVIGCSNNSRSPIDSVLGHPASTAENGLSLTAVPDKIAIDPSDPNTPTDPNNGGKRYGESVLTAVAKDPSGNPQANLALTFSTTAGKLASNGAAVMTDPEGVAKDTLRVYEDDPASINVSVTDGTRTTTIVVTKVVVEPPVANAGPDQTVECTGNSQAAVRLDGSASTDPNNDITLYEWFEHFGAADQVLLGTGKVITVNLAVGVHTITLRVTDATGKTSTDEVVVQVVDTTPPVVDLRVSPSTLWPPNHKLVDVHATVRVQECGTFTVSLVSVTSSEPDNGTGDGDTVGDIQGADIGTADTDFQLRAERSGGGPGRVYTIVYKVVDAVGLETTATAFVKVPHDQSGR